MNNVIKHLPKDSFTGKYALTTNIGVPATPLIHDDHDVYSIHHKYLQLRVRGTSQKHA